MMSLVVVVGVAGVGQYSAHSRFPCRSRPSRLEIELPGGTVRTQQWRESVPKSAPLKTTVVSCPHHHEQARLFVPIRRPVGHDSCSEHTSHPVSLSRVVRPKSLFARRRQHLSRATTTRGDLSASRQAYQPAWLPLLAGQRRFSAHALRNMAAAGADYKSVRS
jgi:hypothetical protein